MLVNQLTHVDDSGNIRMIDISSKKVTRREAIATGSIFMSPETIDLISHGKISKGNVIETARIAGIMAAKRLSEIIPLCHQLNIEYTEIQISLDREHGVVHVESFVKVAGKTGVEMEALFAVSVAALTIYDMCKSVDKGMIISDIKLVRKSGGRSTMSHLKNLYGK
ncbi:MAG: cyclic pyranopterin monophosphate synthase MoaC [Thermodesulfobacteriota bacterium]|nr:cyclic pyranopterin monophosphate synthase MoaC [Thermodesulfobacteriota bacterium]